MTKKDYIIIAKVLNKNFGQFGVIGFEKLSQHHDFATNIVDTLVDELKFDNPRFDEARFRQAIYK